MYQSIRCRVSCCRPTATKRTLSCGLKRVLSSPCDDTLVRNPSTIRHGTHQPPDDSRYVAHVRQPTGIANSSRWNAALSSTPSEPHRRNGVFSKYRS